MGWTGEVLETDRLLLRCLTNDDWPALERVLTDSAVREYLGGPVGAEVLETLATREMGQQPGVFAAAERSSGLVVGTFSIEDERDELELSYQLLPEHWGKGFAAEACRRLIEWVWETTDAPALIAVTQSANARSLGLLERLGFVPETTFLEYDAEQTQARLDRPTSLSNK